MANVKVRYPGAAHFDRRRHSEHNIGVETPESPLDIFFQKMPMGTAIFDRQLALRRWNSTWAGYVEELGAVAASPGTDLYQLLPGTERLLGRYIEQALGGDIVAVDSLRLPVGSTVFHWDAAFAPWIEAGTISGFLLVVTDITERVQSRQLLERRVVDRTRKLTALYDVMSAAAETLDLNETLQRSLDRVLVAVRANAGAIHLLNSKGDRLQLAAENGLPEAVSASFQSLEIGRGLPGAAALLLEPLVLTNAANDSRASDELRAGGLLTYIGAPMTARGKTIGVLSVFRTARRPFSQEDVSVLNSVADQIGTAVENARLRLENERLLIMEERNRLARELHDVVTQSLYSLTLFAETSKRFAGSGDLDSAAVYINQVAQTANQALKEMRLLVHNLRPAILEQVGLVRAIRLRLEAVEKRAGVQTRFMVSQELQLPAHIEEALYHISQEALNNALRHAGASEVLIELKRDNSLVKLVVADNGIGFDPSVIVESGGMGLVSMQERAESLNGTLSVVSRSGEGCRVEASLDLDSAGENGGTLDLIDLLG